MSEDFHCWCQLCCHNPLLIKTSVTDTPPILFQIAMEVEWLRGRWLSSGYQLEFFHWCKAVDSWVSSHRRGLGQCPKRVLHPLTQRFRRFLGTDSFQCQDMQLAVGWPRCELGQVTFYGGYNWFVDQQLGFPSWLYCWLSLVYGFKTVGFMVDITWPTVFLQLVSYSLQAGQW